MIAYPHAQAFRAAVFEALGHAPADIAPGRLCRFSTNGRPGDVAGWCKLFDDMRCGVFGCHRRGIQQTWRAGDLAAQTRAQRIDQARQACAAAERRAAERRAHWQKNASRNAELMQQCDALRPGDPVVRYLSRRGVVGAGRLPAILTCHRSLPYWHGPANVGNFPAMVAPLVAPDGRVVALHRTYLTFDGRKADVPSAKKLTAVAGPLAGACIPLHGPNDGLIGIAEGIETALAATCATGLPTVAAYCAANLGTWQWPAGVRCIVVFADADPAGRDAAEALRQRAAAAGLACEVRLPSVEGADWCDELASRTFASARAGVAE